MLALAKASAVVGAVMVGIWAGLLVYVVPRLGQLNAAGNDNRRGRDRGRGRDRADRGALWLEYCLPDPAPPDGDRQLGRTDQWSRN
jgi:hypothetical protein